MYRPKMIASIPAAIGLTHIIIKSSVSSIKLLPSFNIAVIPFYLLAIALKSFTPYSVSMAFISFAVRYTAAISIPISIVRPHVSIMVRIQSPHIRFILRPALATAPHEGQTKR